MRPIDADRLIKALEITITHLEEEYTEFESEYIDGIKQGIEAALLIVKIAPTIKNCVIVGRKRTKEEFFKTTAEEAEKQESGLLEEE